MKDGISPKHFHQAEGVENWRVLGGDGATAYFRTESLAKAAKFVQAISALPGVDDVRPAIDVRHDGVTLRMITFTKDYAGMTQRHVELARQISDAASKLGLSGDPAAVLTVTVIPGWTSRDAVMPFWRAALG